jgi:hypothetical protein
MRYLSIVAVAAATLTLVGCASSRQAPTSPAQTGSDTIKHLYVLSPSTGKVVLHSAVKGDVKQAVESGESQNLPSLEWRDASGAWHRHYVGSVCDVHITDKPLVVDDIIIDTERHPKQGG